MKILCVEDEVDLAILMDNVLSSDGHLITTCHDGEEAISLITKEDFNLIFLDLEIPKLSGKQVIDSLKNDGLVEINNIVILSANDLEESEIQEFNQKGVKNYLQKPVSMDEILKEVKKFE